MSSTPDPFEFVRNLWSQMGVPGFGAAAGAAGSMPSFAPEDLEKRLGELKQIRQWLELNLNMLNLQVSGLEMQLGAIKGLANAPGADFMARATEAMRSSAGPGGGASAPPIGSGQAFGAGAYGQFPSGKAPPAGDPAPTSTRPATGPAPSAASSKDDVPPAWPDPATWMQTMQEEFAKGMRAMAAPPAVSAPGASAPGARAAAKKPATKKAGAKRGRGPQ